MSIENKTWLNLICVVKKNLTKDTFNKKWLGFDHRMFLTFHNQ